MDWAQVFDTARHFADHLDSVANSVGSWMYVIVFAIVFCETGLVVTPILPGDSLLFGIGAIAAAPGSPLSVSLLIGLLLVAAVAGDALNYYLGARFGERFFRSEKSLLFNKKHLVRTQLFYEKYGGKTIILARFIPIIRTFAPFVAGMGRMRYGRFAIYNIIGAVVWVNLFVQGGYWLGNIEWVKANREYIFVSIVILSILPAVVEIGLAWIRKQKPVQVVAETP
jgi:membrane-associated protein